MIKSGRFEAEFSEHVPKENWAAYVIHCQTYYILQTFQNRFQRVTSEGAILHTSSHPQNSRNFRHRMGHKHTDELQEELRQGELRPVCEDRKGGS